MNGDLVNERNEVKSKKEDLLKKFFLVSGLTFVLLLALSCFS